MSETTQHKITYNAATVVTLTDEGRAHLLQVFADIKSGAIGQHEAPIGFLNALHKLPNGADEDLIIRTILGEVTALILHNELRQFYPPASEGFEVRIAKVSYLETPEALDPPIDAVPQVVKLGDRNLH